MKDSVDRQAVVDIIAEAETYLTIPEVNWYTIERVLHLPSTEPEIIYCGECIHMEPSGKCKAFADPKIRPSASDFCSAGERREG